jgi:hypothetical protein
MPNTRDVSICWWWNYCKNHMFPLEIK